MLFYLLSFYLVVTLVKAIFLCRAQRKALKNSNKYIDAQCIYTGAKSSERNFDIAAEIEKKGLIVPSLYDKSREKTTSFSSIQKYLVDHKNSNILILFSENNNDHGKNIPGGASASVRGMPLCFGIITGYSAGIGNGYKELSIQAKRAIDKSISNIKKAILDTKKFHINRGKNIHIIYPCDKNGILGSGIFKNELNLPYNPVKAYITDQIYSLEPLCKNTST